MNRCPSRDESITPRSTLRLLVFVILAAADAALRPVAWISRRLAYVLLLMAAFYFAISAPAFPLALALGFAAGLWLFALLIDTLRAAALRVSQIGR